MSHPSLLSAVIVDVVGGGAVLLGLVILAHHIGLVRSCLRLAGRRGVTTIAALRTATADSGRCLLVGHLRSGQQAPTGAAWFRVLRTRQIDEMQGEWAVTRTVTLSEDIGPAEIVLDDGTATATVPARLIDVDRWRPAIVKTADSRRGSDGTREWIIPDGAAVVFVGEWVRRGDGVELGSSRTWPADGVASRRAARMMLLLRAGVAALRVGLLACVVAVMAYVVVAVDINLVTG